MVYVFKTGGYWSKRKNQNNMTLKEIESFESKLKEKGYEKIQTCKIESHDDYEWYKAFRDSNGFKYQIFFCFWDFEKYHDPSGWSVSVIISPESCENNVGRRDLYLSVDWSTNIHKVEQCAEMFYHFINIIDKI